MSAGSWLIPISAAALLLIVVAAVVLRHLLTPRVTAPLCARCRYDVTGLPTDVCPECGANLNEVGVLQPGSVKPMSRVMKASLWTVSVSATAIIVTPPILRNVPPLNQTIAQHTLGSPGSGLYATVLIAASRTWRSDPTTATVELNVTLTRLDGRQFDMMVKPEADECRYNDASGQKHREHLPIDDKIVACDVVIAWLDSCGIAATSNALDSEAREIVRTLQEVVNPSAQAGLAFGQMSSSTFGAQMRGFSSGSPRGLWKVPFSSTTMTMNSGRIADPWPLRVAIGWWSLIWLMGIGIILLVAARRNPTEPGVL